jgi:hypothetical protein
MASYCKHIMPGGDQCHGYALQGQDLCYFHSRRRRADQKPVTCMDSIEIPLLEDRCAIQVTITQVLRAIVNKTIDRPRAQLLLYGLQLALLGVDRTKTSIPFRTVKALSEASDGEELAAEPEDEDDDEEEDSDESGDDSDSDDSDGDDDGLDDETTDELIADAKYLQSISNALDAGDTRLAARLLKE